MTKYYCETCGKEFTQKSHYDSHKKRKKPCENNMSNIQKIIDVEVKRAINDLHLKRLVSDNHEINTFENLYEFLQTYNEDNIFGWLDKPWQGKDKQESLLRLFAGLDLVEKLTEYKVCKGNYNLKTIQKHATLKDVFYNESNNLINLKDKGDSSDLTCISKTNNKNILVTTSKNLNKMNVGKLDIDKILTNFQQYISDGYEMTLCICVRSVEDYQHMKYNIETTNKELKFMIDKNDTIILDWNDLNQAFQTFKIYFQNLSLDSIINSNKTTLCLKMHQHLSVQKTMKMKKDNKKKILYGHIQRSGKSYIICGCIIEDGRDKEKSNYLVITTAPNETMEQQIKIFDCLQLQNFNVVMLNRNNKTPKLTDKNIIVCSKQFLQNKEKTKSINWLKNMNFEMRFVDESHNGGTTELAQKTLDYYGKDVFTIQITATYSKPINNYDIPKDCWILWDLEDIKLCKFIERPESINRLVEKHGDEIRHIINKYSSTNIINEYSKYPELWILCNELSDDVTKKIIVNTKNNNYGWSSDACFLLKQCVEDKKILIKEEFQNDQETLNMWYNIFGKKTEFGIPDKKFPDKNVFVKRIEKICKNPMIDSRFIGDTDEPTIIMAFLPQNNINEISKATIKLLKKYDVIPNYEIISINSKITDNPKQTIEDARIIAKNSNKKGVLVLSGKQCSLGVSIDNCDIVLLLNNNMGFDMIYQMMFRCMTEGKRKKCGFVVDLNIHRVIETSIVDYTTLIKPNEHPKEVIKYILQERLINLNGDHWMPSFGNNTNKITTLCENIYEVYSSNTKNALSHFLNRLSFKEVTLSEEEQKIFDMMFNNIKSTKQQKKLIENIKKGIEQTKIENIESSKEKVEKEKTNYVNILRHIIPLICLLTIHNNETSFVKMFNIIESNISLHNILLNQIKSWWCKNIDTTIIKKFINIYIKYMKDDKETNQIIRTVKELFVKNINDRKELSMLVDKYLIPQELEKKSNAEVSTPFKLRQEMLDKIPIEFWTELNKVFEPCSGKGGFLIDIIDRFMVGLNNTILDKKQRYKTIVEECLYFGDINPTNIFICKLLVDPYNKYKLNYNEGNTMELNINGKWNIDVFDAIVGNPPYSTDPSKQNTTPLYNLFTERFINNCDYLLYVIPSRWFVGGKGLNNFRDSMMKRTDIQLIQHEDDATKWFGNNVEIKGGVNYFLKNKYYVGECLFNNNYYNLSKYNCIVKPEHHEFIDKINKYENITKLYISSGFFKYRTNDKRLKNTGNIKCYVSSLKSKNRCKYTDEYVLNDKNMFWKVIASRAAHGAFSGFGFKTIGKPNEIYTDSYISFRVNTEKEAISLLSYLDTKFVNYMLSIRKISQDISEKTCEWIPIVPFDRNWTDEIVCKYFNITENKFCLY
jgi:hypothetical protein